MSFEMGAWMKKSASIAATALAATFASSPADAKWLRAETDSFIIYSEGSEKSLREFAANLQRFDTTLRVIFRTSYEGEDNRLPIYLLPSATDVGELASGSRGSSIAGFIAMTATAASPCRIANRAMLIPPSARRGRSRCCSTNTATIS